MIEMHSDRFNLVFDYLDVTGSVYRQQTAALSTFQQQPCCKLVITVNNAVIHHHKGQSVNTFIRHLCNILLRTVAAIINISFLFY
jgi:hypothetical protein